jgi:hypothetical protein
MENLFFAHPWIVALIIVWSFPWKGVALWVAARRGHIGWFVALLILNTLAILDILYIFIFSKWGESENNNGHKPQAPKSDIKPMIV